MLTTRKGKKTKEISKANEKVRCYLSFLKNGQNDDNALPKISTSDYQIRIA